MDELTRNIEALLFSEGEPISKKRIASQFGVSAESVTSSLTVLSEKLSGGGISLIVSETEAALVVSRSSEEAVKRAQAIGDKDIGEAGLEVLAILIYRGVSTRADIDYIRGVNSSFTIRTLLSRGLLERVKNEKDAREFLYRPTVELLAYLGIKKESEAPEYTAIRTELSEFEATKQGEDSQETL